VLLKGYTSSEWAMAVVTVIEQAKQVCREWGEAA